MTVVRSKFFRFSMAATLVLSGLFLVVPARADSDDTFRLIVTHTAPPLVPNSVMDLAEQLRFYFNQGLKIEIIRVQQTPSAVAALRAGRGDMANISVSTALQLVARDQMKLKAVISPNKSIPFLIASTNTIQTIGDLAGSVFGVGRVGSLDYTLSRLVLSKLGLNPDKLKMVAIGQPRTRAQALLSGRVEATTMSIGVWTSLKDHGKLRILVPQMEYFKAVPVLSKVNVVSDRTLKERRGKVKTFVQAIIVASRKFASNPSLWAEAMSKARPDVPRVRLNKLAKAYAKSWSVNGGLNFKQIAYTVERQYKRKDFKGLRPIRPEEWVDTSLIDTVLKEIGVIKNLDETGR